VELELLTGVLEAVTEGRISDEALQRLDRIRPAPGEAPQAHAW
jgi:hypothetical protein